MYPHRSRSIKSLRARLLVRLAFAAIVYTACTSTQLFSQPKSINGQRFDEYRPKHFRGNRGLNYQFYAGGVVNVDPLGIGGRSTYAIAAGTNITLWESKTNSGALQGLRITSLYTGAGYDFYPEQYDNLYATLGVRIKTFLPVVARMDGLYSFGYGTSGIATRFCVGFDVWKVTVLLTGTIFSRYSEQLFGEHPQYISPYTNSGSVMVLVPFYNHRDR